MDNVDTVPWEIMAHPGMPENYVEFISDEEEQDDELVAEGSPTLAFEVSGQALRACSLDGHVPEPASAGVGETLGDDACPSVDGLLDAGKVPDAGPGSDAGKVADAGPGFDKGNLADGGQPSKAVDADAECMSGDGDAASADSFDVTTYEATNGLKLNYDHEMLVMIFAC